MSYKHRSFSRILLNVDIYCYLNQVVWILEQAENLCWRPLVQADGAAGAAAGGAVVGHPSQVHQGTNCGRPSEAVNHNLECEWLFQS